MSEWFFVDNIMFYDENNKILVKLLRFCFVFHEIHKFHPKLIPMIFIDFLMKIAAVGAQTGEKYTYFDEICEIHEKRSKNAIVSQEF